MAIPRMLRQPWRQCRTGSADGRMPAARFLPRRQPPLPRRHDNKKQTTSSFCASTTCAAPTSGPTARCSKPGSTSANWKTSPPTRSPASTSAWCAWLPALVEHHCGVGERGGFLQRLRRRHLGRPRARTRGHRAAEPGRHAHRLRPDPQHLASAASTAWCSAPATRRSRAPRWPKATALLMAAINDDALRRGGRRGRRARQGRRLLPRPQHRRHRRRRHRPPHPAHPPERRQPGATRLRRAPAPHLDRRDRPHQRHRRRHRQRQGPDQEPAAVLRRAGARRPAGRQRRPRPGKPRRTSACRWWSSRPTATTAAACRST